MSEIILTDAEKQRLAAEKTNLVASFARQNQANLDSVLQLLVDGNTSLESVREKWRGASEVGKQELLQAALDAGWKPGA